MVVTRSGLEETRKAYSEAVVYSIALPRIRQTLNKEIGTLHRPRLILQTTREVLMVQDVERMTGVGLYPILTSTAPLGQATSLFYMITLEKLILIAMRRLGARLDTTQDQTVTVTARLVPPPLPLPNPLRCPHVCHLIETRTIEATETITTKEKAISIDRKMANRAHLPEHLLHQLQRLPPQHKHHLPTELRPLNIPHLQPFPQRLKYRRELRQVPPQWIHPSLHPK